MPRSARFAEPKTAKEMKKIWGRDPWHWIWFHPHEIAAALPPHPHLDPWRRTLLYSERAAMSKNYQVVIKTLNAPPLGEVAHLYIRRSDGSLIRPWKDFQRIKNDLCGPSFTAIEVYPPEDELVDDIDMWHLWCLPAGVRMPFWIGNARKDDVEWTFPGIPLQRGGSPDGH